MEKYVNLHTYEVENEMKDYILVDAEIAEAIAILNKKGYKTNNSCAGHNQVFNNVILNWPVEKKDEFLKYTNTTYVVSEDEKNIIYVPKTLGNSTYVVFAEDYKFENIPDGFILEKINEDEKIYAVITCYNYLYKDDKYKIRKSEKEIDKHLKKVQKNLLEWAKKLNYNKN